MFGRQMRVAWAVSFCLRQISRACNNQIGNVLPKNFNTEFDNASELGRGICMRYYCV